MWVEASRTDSRAAWKEGGEGQEGCCSAGSLEKGGRGFCVLMCQVVYQGKGCYCTLQATCVLPIEF